MPDRDGKIFYTSIASLSHLSKKDGLDVKSILKQAQGLVCMRGIKQIKYDEWENYAYGALKESVLDAKLYDQSYSLQVVRDKLNETLGLANRAVGERLEGGIKDKTEIGLRWQARLLQRTS